MERQPAGGRGGRLDQFKPLHQLDLLHGGVVQQLIINSGVVQQLIIFGRCLCSEGQRNQTSRPRKSIEVGSSASPGLGLVKLA